MQLSAVVGSAVMVLVGIASPVLAQDGHEVQPGETLSEIARDLGVTINDLMEVNRIDDPDRVRAGQVLTIPGQVAAVSAPSSYTVRKGDTLFAISQTLGIAASSLVDANALGDPNRIKEGQALIVPGPEPVIAAPSATAESVPAPSSTGGVHVVEAGDTLSVIARTYGTSMTTLLELNDLENPHRIAIGDVITLPSSSASPSPESASPKPQAPAGPVVPTRAEVRARYPQMPERIIQEPSRRALIATFEKWSAANNLPVDYVMAVAWQESGWRAGAVSSAGAIGIGQIMPDTGAWIASDLIGDVTLTSIDPHENIRMSARYLRWLIDYLGDEELALAGYYQGPGAVLRDEWADTTDGYVASVLAHRQFFVPAGTP